MRKLLLISMGVMLMLGGCAKEKPCVAENGIVCYDEENQRYQIEDGARIRVMVENEAYGQALINLWDAEHPEQTGVIEPIVVQNFDAATWLGYKTDIALLWSNDAAQILNNFMPVQPDLEVMIQEHVPQQFGELLNLEGLRYVPMSYYGLVFSTNVTMLNEMGYDSTDENGDGLVDAFDSFEELMALAEEWGGIERIYYDRAVTAVFPFALSELWASMVFFSADQFRFFATYEALRPGMETDEFLETLKFLRAMGEYPWYLNPQEASGEEAAETAADEELDTEEAGVLMADPDTEAPSEEASSEGDENKKTPDNPGEEEEIILPYRSENDRAFEGGWLYDVYLEKLISPFSLVGTWMYYNQQEDIEQQDFYFSPMPTWKEQSLSPLAKTKGYLLSEETKYPSAANEVLRLIRSEAGIQAYMDTVDEIPAVTVVDRPENRPAPENEEAEGKGESDKIVPYYLSFRNENQRQISHAFSLSQEESMVAFEKDPSVRGWDMLSEIGLIEIAESVIKQEMTPEEAQLKLLERSESWMTPYKPAEEVPES
ncbi:hypothetical protein [uncultured Holdemania sp.]|mgnify:FL=1|uniref:hypothetical protein n=1 Tax=uncultured Holdemania sp. TaxID=527664 RepID=UPI002804E325|nr:hypothetical protein [uncultured Holdemania sp.]